MDKKTKQRRDGKTAVSAGDWMEQHDAGYNKALKLPSGVNIFKIKEEADYNLDFIPFLTGSGNPFQKAVGVPYWERTYWSHRDVGPNEEAVPCLAKNFNKPCPICEERARLARTTDSDDDRVKALRPTERQLFNVIDLDNPDRGIQVWDYSEFLFGSHLRGKLQRAKGEERNRLSKFPSITDGLTLKIGAVKSKKGKWFTCSDIEFKTREHEYPDDIIEKATCLDDCIVQPEYDDIKMLFEQGPIASNTEDDGTTTPAASVNGDGESSGGEKVNPFAKKKAAAAAPKKEAPPAEEPEETAEPEEDAPAAEPEAAPEEDPEPEEKAGAKTAAELGIALGMWVIHDDFGKCQVVKVSKDGSSLTLEDKSDELHMGVDPNDVAVVQPKKDAVPAAPAKTPAKAATPPAKPAVKKPPVEDDDDIPFAGGSDEPKAKPKPKK